MIWNRYSMASAAISIGLTASLVSYQAAYAVRARNYTIREMRAVLNGFGYNVPLGDTVDQATTDAIREFQRGYKIPVDGTPNPQTQDLMADLVGILQANLNLVVKPGSPLPRNQFYGPLTEAVVRQYQQKAGLPVTGIATLAMRQRLDQEAERMLNNQSAPSVPGTRSQPTPTPSPTPTPTPSPTPTPRAIPTPSPTPTPRAIPTPSPTSTPRAIPTPTLTPTPRLTPTPIPPSTPRAIPTPTLTPTPQLTPIPSPTSIPNNPNR